MLHFVCMTYNLKIKYVYNSVADPGFPIGGVNPTSNAGAFWQKCIRK